MIISELWCSWFCVSLLCYRCLFQPRPETYIVGEHFLPISHARFCYVAWIPTSRHALVFFFSPLVLLIKLSWLLIRPPSYLVGMAFPKSNHPFTVSSRACHMQRGVWELRFSICDRKELHGRVKQRSWKGKFGKNQLKLSGGDGGNKNSPSMHTWV